MNTEKSIEAHAAMIRRQEEDSKGPGPRVGPPSERGQKKLAMLRAKGRVEPVLKNEVLADKSTVVTMLVGWRRKGDSRKQGEWTLHHPRPWQQPRAILRRTRGAELVHDEFRSGCGALGYAGAAAGLQDKHELANAARCYSLYAIKQRDPGDDFARFTEELLKFWPWPREIWRPSADAIENRAKAGGLYWAEAERLRIHARDTGAKHQQMLDAADNEAAQIDRLLEALRQAADSTPKQEAAS